MTLTADSIPVAYTPAGGWAQWPPPVLASCTQPLCDGAPDMRGFWQTVEVTQDGVEQPGHPALGGVQRIEQADDRVVVTGGGIIHDMRCDGTLRNGVHDVAEFDKTVEIHVVACFEDGVHVLRPHGLDPGIGRIEVRRWRDAEHLMWDYIGFTARLRWLAPPDADPELVFARVRTQEQTP